MILKHASSSTFDVGTKVLLKGFTRKKRKGGKLDKKWKGPFKIRKNIGKGLYRISDVENPLAAVRRVAGTHLKRYLTPSSSFNDTTCPSQCSSPTNSIIESLSYPSNMSSENQKSLSDDTSLDTTVQEMFAQESPQSPLNDSNELSTYQDINEREFSRTSTPIKKQKLMFQPDVSPVNLKANNTSGEWTI